MQKISSAKNSAKNSLKPKDESKTVVVNMAAATKRLQNAIDKKIIAGSFKESHLFREIHWEGFENIIVVGVGTHTSHEHLRQAAAAAFKSITAAKSKSVTLLADGLGSSRETAQTVRALAEGMVLASYKFDELKTKKKNKDHLKDHDQDTSLRVTIAQEKADDKNLQRALVDAVTLAETVNFSRRLGDLPGNLMTPTLLAEATMEAAQNTKVKVTAWDLKRIQKENMGGLLSVAQGSAQEPRFIILEYKGGTAQQKPLVYVGKGLTFDTGGISIKPSAGMEEMKYDMCGGANVIGAVLAIAKLGLKVNVVGLVPSTENMPGSRATKPGDVFYARNGKSFEVNNTDAEGRLILSDALCYGSELNPEMMIDAATLTGAMVVALGNTHTGYFTRNSKLRDQVEKAAEASGEWVWNMPLTDFHVDDMKGTYADLSNMSSGKGAGSATAAAYLEQFVGEGIPWAHFDIAGTGWAVGSRLNYSTPKGASGAMVRTFVELARLYANSSSKK